MNLMTKTFPDSSILSCILNIGPKSLLEYRGRPLIVFEAKITICKIRVGTKNKNLYSTLTFMNLMTKTFPDSLILSCILNIGPKSLLECRGLPLIVFEAN